MNAFLYKLKSSVFVVLTICMMSSCVEDDPLPISGTPPTISIFDSNSDTTITSTSLSVNSITLTAFSESSPLESLTIKKNGSTTFSDTITIDGSVNTSHHIDLSGTDKTSFSYNINLNVLRGEAAVFTFSILAENNDSISQTLTLNVRPELSISSGTAPLSVEVDSMISLEFSGLQGTTLLSTLAVFENNDTLNLSRLVFGNSMAASNPILLGSNQLLGFTENITFRALNADTSATYKFILVDDLGLDNSVSILVNTMR